MRLLVCGDRRYTDQSKVADKIAEIDIKTPIKVLIEGGCLGADRLARLVAEFLGIPVLTFSAHWYQEGLGAGPVRNQRMIDEGKPDYFLAFHPDIERSKGTKDMVSRLRRSGVPGEIIS